MGWNVRRLKRSVVYARIALQSGWYALFHHEPFRKAVAIPFTRYPLTWTTPLHKALMANYVRQFNEASCSVASSATVLNAARQFLFGNSCKPIGQDEILEGIRVIHWRERISKEGFQGKRGLPIEKLGIAVEACFRQFAVPFSRLEVFPLSPKKQENKQTRHMLLSKMTAVASGSPVFLIAHFNQGALVRGIHLPHISPVGTFDTKEERALVLDVDPEQQPYWVSLSALYKAMCSDFGGALRQYGYDGGGYVWIQL